MKPQAIRVTLYFCGDLDCGQAIGYAANEDDERRVGVTYGDEGFGGGRIHSGDPAECAHGHKHSIPKRKTT